MMSCARYQGSGRRAARKSIGSHLPPRIERFSLPSNAIGGMRLIIA